MIEKLQASARVEIDGPNGKPLKAYKGDSNHCFEIWRMPPPDGELKAQAITTFDAHSGSDCKPHPAAKRLFRVFKRDMVAIERDGKTLICYVQRLDPANGVFLAPHTEANADARNRDKNDQFRFIQMAAKPLLNACARRVYVDEIGQLNDPGPSQ